MGVFGHHCRVQEWAEADLAWQLADPVAGRLSDVSRTAIFAEDGLQVAFGGGDGSPSSGHARTGELVRIG
jgi:hypothetical protein